MNKTVGMAWAVVIFLLGGCGASQTHDSCTGLSDDDCWGLAVGMLSVPSPSSESISRAEFQLTRLCGEGRREACDTLVQRGASYDLRQRSPGRSSENFIDALFRQESATLRSESATDRERDRALSTMTAFCANGFLAACDWVVDLSQGAVTELSNRCESGDDIACVAVVRAFALGRRVVADIEVARTLAERVCPVNAVPAPDAPVLWCEDVAGTFAAAGRYDLAHQYSPVTWQDTVPVAAFRRSDRPQTAPTEQPMQAASLRGAIRSMTPALRTCYGQQLGHRAAFGPVNVVLHFTILTSGVVGNVGFWGPALGRTSPPDEPVAWSTDSWAPERLLECVGSAVRATDFAAGPERLTIRYPVRFSPSEP